MNGGTALRLVKNELEELKMNDELTYSSGIIVLWNTENIVVYRDREMAEAHEANTGFIFEYFVSDDIIRVKPTV